MRFAVRLVRALLVAAVLTFVAVDVRPVQAQDDSILERVQQLDLDSLDVGLWIYYSRGYEDRARYIGRMVAESDTFYRDSLGIKIGIPVALLSPSDHERAGLAMPYGFPFFRDGVAVLPAENTSGVVVDAYLPFEPTATMDVRTALEVAGLSYNEAVHMMVDLIGLHEIGHAQIDAADIDTRQRWFDELLSSYFAYAYMRSRDPEKAVVWDAVTRAAHEGYEPAHTSLDDFNRLYIGVGVDNYNWYQSMLQGRVRSVYEAQGLNFLRAVRARLGEPMAVPESAAELLAVLEEIAPGFVAWGKALDQ